MEISLPVLVLQPFSPTNVCRKTSWQLSDHLVNAKSSCADPGLAILIAISSRFANMASGSKMGRGNSESMSEARSGKIRIYDKVGICEASGTVACVGVSADRGGEIIGARLTAVARFYAKA